MESYLAPTLIAQAADYPHPRPPCPVADQFSEWTCAALDWLGIVSLAFGFAILG